MKKKDEKEGEEKMRELKISKNYENEEIFYEILEDGVRVDSGFVIKVSLEMSIA